MKQAVCILIPSKFDYGFIAVSRRNDPTKWGLPGGKVDAGESNLDAIVRESLEEIFLEVQPDELMPLYSGVSRGEVPYWSTTYLYSHSIDFAGLKAEEGLTIRSLGSASLCDSTVSPFAVYNGCVFTAMMRFMRVVTVTTA